MGKAAAQAGKRTAYPAYKPSGTKWVGDIPEHWEVQRLKHVASLQFSSVDKHTVEGEEPVRLCNYVDVYYNDFIAEGLDFMAATATRSEIARFQLRHGDVLITKDSESWDDIAVPAYVAEELDGVLCGYHLAHIRPDLRKLLGEYLFRAFRSRGVNDQFRVAANGITRFGLGKYWLDNGLFPIPPLDEQRAIAAFLDRETARIDALIEKKRRQIELLQEKRSALISHAVTRGPDPSAPMKDSGIEWLGEIPEHWKAIRIRHVISHLEQGWSPQCEGREAGYDEWGVLKAGCANYGSFNELAHKVLPGHIEPQETYEVKPGDVVMSRACGTAALVGSAAYVERCRPRLLLCDKLFRLHAHRERCDARYLHLALNSRSARAQIEMSISGADGLANNITQPTIKNIVIGLPPLNEQRAIVKNVHRVTSRTDALMMKVEHSIDLLQEHRTALISAAVTGKIDVGEEVG